MARVTVEDCIDKVENRFELVLLAEPSCPHDRGRRPAHHRARPRQEPGRRPARDRRDAPIAGRPQGRPDPLDAEICRGRRARGRGRAAARPPAARFETTETHSTGCRRRTCCAASKVWSRRPTRTTTRNRLAVQYDSKARCDAGSRPVPSGPLFSCATHGNIAVARRQCGRLIGRRTRHFALMRQYELVDRVRALQSGRQRGSCSTPPMSMPCSSMASRCAPRATPISPIRSRSRRS